MKKCVCNVSGRNCGGTGFTWVPLLTNLAPLCCGTCNPNGARVSDKKVSNAQIKLR